MKMPQTDLLRRRPAPAATSTMAPKVTPYAIQIAAIGPSPLRCDYQRIMSGPRMESKGQWSGKQAGERGFLGDGRDASSAWRDEACGGRPGRMAHGDRNAGPDREVGDDQQRAAAADAK